MVECGVGGGGVRLIARKPISGRSRNGPRPVSKFIVSKRMVVESPIRVTGNNVGVGPGGEANAELFMHPRLETIPASRITEGALPRICNAVDRLSGRQARPSTRVESRIWPHSSVVRALSHEVCSSGSYHHDYEEGTRSSLPEYVTRQKT